ncbi:protein ORF142 [Cyprinid herpesvirus 1]|uniref:Protein ORF142 n=1 Tax=Cyprinid herpesvirus 1 TaxID=317858 RepID=K7PBE3_9VIRU|nr:protein ORF142 [Cyprinid herpesvirus 1]AFJ20429.1 protein ORF142 [Cyprinid herpesvirus 1]
MGKFEWIALGALATFLLMRRAKKALERRLSSMAVDLMFDTLNRVVLPALDPANQGPIERRDLELAVEFAAAVVRDREDEIGRELRTLM